MFCCWRSTPEGEGGREESGWRGRAGLWVSFCYHQNGVVVHVRDENKCHLPPEIIHSKNSL